MQKQQYTAVYRATQTKLNWEVGSEFSLSFLLIVYRQISLLLSSALWGGKKADSIPILACCDWK